ncbi:MAG: PEP-CTERM sorting domain-containing protein, partial [Fimbriimonadales bacterium]|nr:PEP-CTERM sorting domain-containing protein [Fimbriimonadales bacterium]
ILGVHFGFDGLGPRPNVVGVYGTTPHFQAQWFEDYGTTFAGFGLAWTNIFIPPGGKVTLEGRLTLLADPDAGFDYTDEFNSRPEVVQNLPDLGYMPVPEPASMTALGVGLLTLLARRRRRRA